MAEGEIDLTKAATPWPGEQLWAPSPAMPAVRQSARGSVPAAAPEAPKRDLAEAVGEIIFDEVALVHPVLEHAVAPMTGEPISSAIGLAALALELIDLTHDAPPMHRAPAAAAPSIEQVWGPGGLSPAALKCCRDSAAEGRPCALHPKPSMW